MTIRYDKTSISIVVWCTCGWRELVLSQAAAWILAERHERAVHPDQRAIRHAAEERRSHDMRRRLEEG